MDTALMVGFMFSLKFSHFFDLGLSIFFTVKSIKMLCKFESCFQFFFFSCILFCYTFNQLLGNYLKLNAQIRLINSSV